MKLPHPFDSYLPVVFCFFGKLARYTLVSVKILLRVVPSMCQIGTEGDTYCLKQVISNQVYAETQ